MIISKKQPLIAQNLKENGKSSLASTLDNWQIYKQGVITNTFNPKVALFFLAFFPQFIDPSYSNSMLSFIVLGLTFATTGFIWCTCLALLASKFSANLRQNPAIEGLLNKISGIVFLGLGLKLFTENG